MWLKTNENPALLELGRIKSPEVKSNIRTC